MKVARFLLNTLLWIVTFVFIILAQYSVTALITLQAGDDADRVRFVADDSQVSYLDTFTWLGADLSAGYAQEDGFWIRSWFGAPSWWVNGMEWADVALTKTVVTLKAIFVPVLDINTMKEKHISGYYKTNADGSYSFVEEEYDESWKSYPEGYYKTLMSDAAFTYREDLEAKEAAEWTSAIAMLEAEISASGSISETEWKNDYGDQYSFIRLSAHYNTEQMQTFYSKFINSDGSIKFEVISVYTQYIIGIVCASFFVHNNKFRLSRDEESGENTVEGGYKGLPGFGKKKKKKKKS